VEIYGHYFTANKIAEDKVKVHILCASVGPRTYHIIKNLCLPDKPESKTFKDLTDIVKGYYKPKISEASASLIFNNRVRKPEETVQVFVAELRRLVQSCNYGEHLKRALRDRFIAGINDKDIQEKILTISDDELTFDKACQIAQAHEAACRNVKELQRGQMASVNKLYVQKPWKQSKDVKPKKPQDEKYVKKTSERNKRCFRCGNDHNPNMCWFKTKECYGCGKRGHTKTMCRSESQTVKHVTEDIASDDNSDVEVHTLYHLNENVSKVPPIPVTVKVDGKDQSFELDTGSPFTMISVESAREVMNNVEEKLKKSTVQIKSFTGHGVHVHGSLDVTIEYNNQCYDAEMLVTDYKPTLLGSDLIEKLQMKVMKISCISENDDDNLQAVLHKHQNVFNKELGKLKGFQAKIHVNDDTTPIFYQARQVPYAMRSKVEDELKRLEKETVIESVKYSEWAAPVVPVLKPNGEIRLCGDYKVTVNRVSKLEQYPIPTLDEITTKLAHGSVYHKLDLSHAYAQIELEPESRKYVTVNTIKGLYQYSRLPYGIASAPAIFQRVIESVLCDLPSTAVYLDDILVTGRTVSESLKNLDDVLSRLEDAGLRLKKQKCMFMADTVTYLGHRISKAGIEPVTEKVKAIVQAQPPANVTQLKAFLGLLNYYGRFLKDLSHELHPLHKLLHKDVKWAWGASQQQCFEKVKSMMVSARVLVHYNPSYPLILQCDASAYGLGCVLSHMMPDGFEHPIGFVSRTLNAAEKNYSQLDKEGASIIFGLKKFHKYVYGRAFTIVTDHKPLIYLFHEEKQIPMMASPRLQRWAVIMRAYEYSIEYKPGPEHQNADCFSRLPLKETVPVEDEDCTVLALKEVEEHTLLTAEQLADWTKYDPVMSNVHEYILRGWPSEQMDPKFAAYKVRKDELSVLSGVILWGARVVVPPRGRTAVLQELHAGHPGATRMKALARSYVWYPGLDSAIEETVASCVTCQEHRKCPAVAPLHPWEYPDGAWKRIHIDYAGPYKGVMLLIIVDAYSKWIETFITQSTSSETTIKKLRECFAQHGIPDMIVSDNAAYFRSEEFADFTRKNGIQHTFVAPFHPSGNGLAERAVQTIKEGLEKTEGDCLHTKLYRFLLLYRITPQTTTGKSPSELLNHRKLKTTLDLLHPSTRGKVTEQQMKMKQYHDRNARRRSLEVGEIVRVKNFASGPK